MGSRNGGEPPLSGDEVLEEQNWNHADTTEISVVGDECFGAVIDGSGDLERIGRTEAKASAELSCEAGHPMANRDDMKVWIVADEHVVLVGDLHSSHAEWLDGQFHEGQD